ncbi:glycoside hydrolase family 18 protein [Coprinopsis marcescibilis]|uniref:chitinase n=1 Tax=Coprinopsis marcescibilis TaxID=230819 RepID=A0A5C3KJ04_COPMA|nr:glycoside hydrolase family 18 protein [Coprinopsis marcescibilis]
MYFVSIGLSFLFAWAVKAFDNNRFDNVFHSMIPLYWGQNSYGAGHSDTQNFQKRLSFYCNDNAIDVFPVAFLHVFFGTGGLPSVNLANTCNPTDNATFPGTTLPNCASLASDITTCQSKGKIVTLSLGGATGAVGFQSASQATTFAQTVWDLFLGGRSSTRPFGSAILDGVDLDIEGGTSAHYGTFINRIRSLAGNSGKKYYFTAAPQCVYPDAALGGVLNEVAFDAVYDRFYNNYCGLQNFNQASNWNFGMWDHWARFVSVSRNTKVYIGSPASVSAAGSGHVDINTLSRIATQMRRSFPSFGGVMLWDASQAYGKSRRCYANNRYDRAIKNALAAAGGTGFSYPGCSAPAYVSGRGYSAGSQVTFGGFIWQAKFFASQQPASTPNGEWSAISVCSGGGTNPSPSPTVTTPRPGPTGGSCAGVGTWSSGSIYLGGDKAVYNGRLWTAKWWTQNDAPGGSVGVWEDNGACAARVPRLIREN